MSNKPAGNPVKIVDTTFRDGHQSSLATRMRTEDMEILATKMDEVGFHAMEVWGGATFDVSTRYLNADPWDRLRRLKKLLTHTPIQMLLRGQNLVGYRNYADDVVEAFIYHTAECGMDIFRVFDALNDERNFEVPLKAIKRCGKHAQLSLCYSLTERRLGGPVYNIDYYVKKARILEDMGADSLCIKDMAGLIAPGDVYDLVTALKQAIKIPINLHTHYTSGMASMAYLKAIEASVDIVDTCLSPFALRSSQPAIEPFVVALQGSSRDTGLDLAQLAELSENLEIIAPKYRDFLDTTRMAVIDAGVLLHQIPGGMTTNLVAQLREANALDRIGEVYREIPRTRKELGYPPLVTPTSQIVGIQAVQNVLFGRYKMISAQVKDYIYGLYGKPPAHIDPEVQKIALKGYHRGEEPITCRAADILEPELERAKEVTKDIARDMCDVLTYALYPTTGMAFLKSKYGLAPLPTTTEKPKSSEDVKQENEMIANAKSGDLVDKTELRVLPKYRGLRAFNVYVGGGCFKLEVEEVDGATSEIKSGINHASAEQLVAEVMLSQAGAAVVEKTKAVSPSTAPMTKVKSGERETVMVAPMPGILIRYEVGVGDEVNADDIVVVIESMKMENLLPSPIPGNVAVLNYKSGDKVQTGDILLIIREI